MWLSIYCSNAFSYFTLFLIRNSSPTSCLSIHIKADKIQTSKGLNCLIHFSSSQRTKNILSSSLGVFVVLCSLQGKFSTLTFCFTHSFLHCYKWIHETVLFFFVSKIECSSVTEQEYMHRNHWRVNSIKQI